MTTDMKRQKQLDHLVETLVLEKEEYRQLTIPDNFEEKRKLLRSLVNVRSPLPIGKEFLKVQDQFLIEEVKAKGIIDVRELPTINDLGWEHPSGNRICLWQGDITRLKTDAIVNAANAQMLGCFVPCHGCIDNAIHTAAGVQLRAACKKIMEEQGHLEPVGTAKLTGGYNLPCSYVIHTVGPIVREPLTMEHSRQLKQCYTSCLKLAADNHLKTIAFCCISTGEYHFPGRKAAEIAVTVVEQFLKENKSLERIIFNVFQDEDFNSYGQMLQR